MTQIEYLGIIPELCENFPEATTLPLPEKAYLPLTLEQLIFIHWKVKKWEISYEFSANTINQTVTTTYLGNSEFQQYAFSYPAKSVTYERLGAYIQRITGTPTERNLVCGQFNSVLQDVGFGLSGAGFPPFMGNQSLAIGSTEILTYDPPDPNQPYVFDHSRNSYGETLFAYSPNISSGSVIGIDARKIGNTYYFPYTVGIQLEISTGSSDNLLFAEQIVIENAALGATTIGVLPPIGGYLTTNPEGAYTTSPYKVKIQVSEDANDVIEMDLFDKTEPSPLTSTRFNVLGFNGIKIKPTEYWTYGA